MDFGTFRRAAIEYANHLGCPSDFVQAISLSKDWQDIKNIARHATGAGTERWVAWAEPTCDLISMIQPTKSKPLAEECGRLEALNREMLEELRDSLAILEANCDCGKCGPCDTRHKIEATIAKTEKGA